MVNTRLREAVHEALGYGTRDHETYVVFTFLPSTVV